MLPSFHAHSTPELIRRRRPAPSPPAPRAAAPAPRGYAECCTHWQGRSQACPPQFEGCDLTASTFSIAPGQSRLRPCRPPRQVRGGWRRGDGCLAIEAAEPATGEPPGHAKHEWVDHHSGFCCFARGWASRERVGGSPGLVRQGLPTVRHYTPGDQPGCGRSHNSGVIPRESSATSCSAPARASAESSSVSSSVNWRCSPGASRATRPC